MVQAFGNAARSEQSSGDGFSLEDWQNASPEERQRTVDLAVNSAEVNSNPATLLADCSSCVDIRGRFGVFGSVKGRLGFLRVSGNVDLFSIWTGGPYMTQGIAADFGVGNKTLSIGFSRSSRSGGLNWSDWEWGGGAFDVYSSSDSVDLVLGVGVGIGAEVKIPLISPAY